MLRKRYISETECSRKCNAWNSQGVWDINSQTTRGNGNKLEEMKVSSRDVTVSSVQGFRIKESNISEKYIELV